MHLRKLLSDKELAHKIGENGRKLAKELAPENVDREWMEYLTQRL